MTVPLVLSLFPGIGLPIGMLNRLWRYPDQTIEPFHFGEEYRKRTCLWLRGLPPLLATVIYPDGEPYLSYSPVH